MKVTIVGAGNVGATCADAIAYRRIASEIVLLDIKEGFAEGKALDIMQTQTTLGFNTKMSAKQVVIVLMIAFVGLILSGALGEINQAIPLPAKWLAAAKEAEAKYKESMMSMVTMKTTTDYLLSLIVMAIAPAIFEEMLFRGALQKIFVGWIKNSFWAILLASILFSAIHFSFFGFLPRVALGMILGYVFYFSKNLWLNIFIHFLYNGIIVTQLFVATKQGKQLEKAMDETMPIWLGLIAVVSIFVLMRLFKQESDLELAMHPVASKKIELNEYEKLG